MNSSEEKGNNRQKSENSIIDESTDRVEKIDSEKDDYVGKKLNNLKFDPKNFVKLNVDYNFRFRIQRG